MDTLVRGTSMDGSIRVICATTTDLVNKAVRIHNTYPVATAALGRLLTAGSMMGNMLKSKDNTLTLRLAGGGPAGNLIVVSDWEGDVRGYVSNPVVEIPLNNKGKLDVAGAVGRSGNLY